MSKRSHLSTAKPKKRSRFAFVGEIVGELRKVVWPTRREAIRLTIMVLIVTVIVGIVLGTLDYGFAELVSKLFLGGS